MTLLCLKCSVLLCSLLDHLVNWCHHEIHQFVKRFFCKKSSHSFVQKNCFSSVSTFLDQIVTQEIPLLTFCVRGVGWETYWGWRKLMHQIIKFIVWHLGIKQRKCLAVFTFYLLTVMWDTLLTVLPVMWTISVLNWSNHIQLIAVFIF